MSFSPSNPWHFLLLTQIEGNVSTHLNNQNPVAIRLKSLLGLGCG
ncbi:hypothetical protein COO91_05502 [Nostoc flagelliforme CCNUN1]|uniref:Uncharacterized protein n=1 Tax=Nostoc flagelliforme CCNUN1 TaxID=2038116 RepID=A0A2K8SVN6_9NOSO|nr:hypothetical protein COO91_05502 [Nostoc flagelliforme CCNUN1]